jgi:hypothetical protein
MRRGNLSTVLRLLHAEGTTTRAALTARTGLNRSTTADLVRELVECGLVTEGEPLATGAPGRPSPTVNVRTDRVFVLALDVRVDSLAAASVTLGGSQLHTQRLERARTRTDVTSTLDDLTRLAAQVSEPLPRQQRLVGIVTHDDAIDVIQEEATEDIYRYGAVPMTERSYFAASTFIRSRRRVLWLAVLILVHTITHWVAAVAQHRQEGIGNVIF